MKPNLTIIGRSFGNTGDPYSFTFFVSYLLAPYFNLKWIFGTKLEDPFIHYFQELQKHFDLEWFEFSDMGNFPEVFETLFARAREIGNDALVISQGVTFSAEDVLEARKMCDEKKLLAYSIAIETQNNFQAFPGLAGYHAFRYLTAEYLHKFKGISPAAKTGFLNKTILRVGEKLEPTPIGGNEEVTADLRIIKDYLDDIGLSWGQALPNALFGHRVTAPLFMGIRTSSDQVGFQPKLTRKAYAALAQVSYEFGNEQLYQILLSYQTAWWLL